MITVALPLWQAKDVAWICLESLCRQKTIIPWELIICEERIPNRLGEDGVSEYIERLQAVGCVNVNYITEGSRLLLAYKWKKMVDYVSDGSIGYIMCGADNFYQPLMVQQSYDALKGGADWFSTYECHFYDINTKAFVRFNRKSYSGIEMALSIPSAQKIIGSGKKKGIDSFVFRTVAPENRVWNETGCGMDTVCTHGKNLISWNRGKLINRPASPFKVTNNIVEDYLPPEILERLCE